MRRRIRNISIIAVLMVTLLLIAAMVAIVNSPREIATDLSRGALERAGFEKRVFDHDQGHITYFEGGEGPTVVFVHGLADQAGSWFRIAPNLEEYRVILVDLPRHGESPFDTDEEVLTDEVFVPLFELLYARIGDERATFIANSLGGWIVMEYALSHPEQVEQLILANSAGLSYEVDTTLLTPSNRDEARRTVRTIFGDSAPPLPGFILDRIVERAGESLASRVVTQMEEVEFLDSRLPEIDTPIHLVWGDQDLIFPMDYAHKMDDLLPHSELHIIEGCGHSPQVGCPNEFMEIIDAVLGL